MNIARYRKNTVLLISVLATGLLLGSLFFALQKPVTIQVDGNEIKTRVFFANTVEDVLAQKNIDLGPKDLVSPSLNQMVKKNTRIVVVRAFKIKVIADGKTRILLSPPVTVKEAVKLAGFALSDQDIVKTLPTPRTVPGQEIEVIRVTNKEETVQQPIPFQIERTTDPSLEKGLTKTVSRGQEGMALNTIRITYHNGVEVKRDIIKSEVLQEPKNKVVAMGTITSVSRGGERLNFREVRYMEASAYTYTGYRTATGRNPEVGVVATDPSVIPMGTRLYIEGYGYARAGDTGGAIKGDKIDLFMEEHSQCISWGRRMVKVYILS
jgi:3D (Asp-Asp-Asp) domain-containing protein